MIGLNNQGGGTRPRREEPKLVRIFIYAALGGWAFICLFPMYWLLATSLKGPLEIVSGPVYAPFIDYAPSLDAWAYILFNSNDAPLLRYFNSVVVGLTSTTLTVTFAGFAVYGLTRFRHVVSYPAIAFVLVAAGFACLADLAAS